MGFHQAWQTCEAYPIHDDFVGFTVIGVASEAVPGDNRIGFELSDEPAHLHCRVAGQLDLGIAIVEESYLTADDLAHFLPMDTPFSGHLGRVFAFDIDVFSPLVIQANTTRSPRST